MFVKSTCFKQVCQLLLSLIVDYIVIKVTRIFRILGLRKFLEIFLEKSTNLKKKCVNSFFKYNRPTRLYKVYA